MKTYLSLDYSGNSSEKVLRIFDTSHYGDDTIENYMIEVLPPSQSKWINFFVKKNFSLALNSSNLRYVIVGDTDGLIALPDGIYEFKQSYKQNIKTVVHYLHLRVTSLMHKLKAEKDKLLAETCKISREEFIQNRNALREIEEYIEAAVYKVEDCSDKKKGLELYEWAKKLLEQYSNECKC